MSKHCGDIPCANLNGIIHITISGTKCACGREWAYGRPSRSEKKCVNIIWREKEAVTCPDCLAAYEKTLAENEVAIVLAMESAITYKNSPFKKK